MRSTTGLGIAAPAGRWSARHRAKAIVGWLVFVLLVAAIGGSAGRKELTGAETRDGQSAAASRTLDSAPDSSGPPPSRCSSSSGVMATS